MLAATIARPKTVALNQRKAPFPISALHPECTRIEVRPHTSRNWITVSKPRKESKSISARLLSRRRFSGTFALPPFLTRLDRDPFRKSAHLDVRAVDREVDAMPGEMQAGHLDVLP